MPKLCVALDVEKERALWLVRELSDFDLVFKVGPRLFLEGGREVVEFIKERGLEVFLDLKLHDIPNTVRLAVEEADELGVDYLTLHTLGGREMMEWAVSIGGDVKLVGVTILTSHGEEYLEFLRSSFGSLEELSLYLARTAKECGLYGVVSSVREARRIKENTGLFLITPGVRISSEHGDQKRVSTPEEAFREGSDMVVMGRDIYGSEDPKGAVISVLERMGGA